MSYIRCIPVESIVSHSLMAAGKPRNRLPEYFQHLGHEGQRLQAAAFVECGEDLIDALHLDQFADAEPNRMRVPDVGGVHPDSPSTFRPRCAAAGLAPILARRVQPSGWASADPGAGASVSGKDRVAGTSPRSVEHDGSGDAVKMRLRHALPAGLLDADSPPCEADRRDLRGPRTDRLGPRRPARCSSTRSCSRRWCRWRLGLACGSTLPTWCGSGSSRGLYQVFGLGGLTQRPPILCSLIGLSWRVP